MDSGRRRLRVVVLLVVTALALLTLDFRGVGPIDRVQETMRDILDPLRSATATVTEPIGNMWNGLFDYGDLENENEVLRARVAELEGDALRAESDAETLERLLAQVDLPYVGDNSTAIARVVRGPAGNFGSNVVEISKGTDAGVAENMAVVTNAGLVGTVIRADRTSSLVRLIHDPQHEFGVRVTSSGEPGLASGTGDPDRLSLRFVDDSVAVEDGAAVVTVGPEGQSRYPADIPVGRVVIEESDDPDLPDLLTIEPAADVDRLDFVTIVLFVAEPDGSGPLGPGRTSPTTIVPSSVPDDLGPSTTSVEGSS